MLHSDVVIDLLHEYRLILGIGFTNSCENTVYSSLFGISSLVSDLKQLNLITACNEITIVLAKLVRRNAFNASLVSVPNIGINDVFVQKSPLTDKKRIYRVKF